MKTNRCTDCIALLAALLLAGCSGSIDAEEIELATKLCEPHGGLLWISTSERSAYCKNNLKVTYYRVKQ